MRRADVGGAPRPIKLYFNSSRSDSCSHMSCLYDNCISSVFALVAFSKLWFTLACKKAREDSVGLKTCVYSGTRAWTICRLETKAPYLLRFPRCYMSVPLYLPLPYKAHLRRATQSSRSLYVRYVDSLLAFYILVLWVHYNII